MLSIKKLIITLSGLLLGMGLLNLFAQLSMLDNAETRFRWIKHTNQVIYHTQELLGQLRDAETGQRGYLLAQNPSYLEPYYSGLESIWHHFRTLKQLTEDNSAQQQRLTEIELLMVDKFNELNETIEQFNQGNSTKAIELVQSDYGKQVMDKLRLLIDAFVSTEQELLSEREQALEDSKDQLQALLILLGLTLLLTILLTSSLTYKSIVIPIMELTAKASRISSGHYEEFSFKSKNEIGRLAGAFNQMAQDIKNRTRELEKTNSALIELSLEDGLTHLSNRRHFDQKLEQEFKHAKRNKVPLSLLMLDIDYFKAFNDTYGHLAGDDCLKRVSFIIKQYTSRPTDLSARYGGEEFAMILPDTDLGGAQFLAESIHNSLAQEAIPHQSSQVSSFVSMSIGLVAFNQLESYQCPKELIDEVDKQLYQAKSNGRNQTCAISTLKSTSQ